MGGGGHSSRPRAPSRSPSRGPGPLRVPRGRRAGLSRPRRRSRRPLHRVARDTHPSPASSPPRVVRPAARAPCGCLVADVPAFHVRVVDRVTHSTTSPATPTPSPASSPPREVRPAARAPVVPRGRRAVLPRPRRCSGRPLPSSRPTVPLDPSKPVERAPRGDRRARASTPRRRSLPLPMGRSKPLRPHSPI